MHLRAPGSALSTRQRARRAPPGRLEERRGSGAALCSCGGQCPRCHDGAGPQQADWTISSPHHRHERAADHLARRAGPNAPNAPSAPSASDRSDWAAPVGFAAALAALPGARPLAGAERRHHEAAFGHGLGEVRLHDGPQAEALARSVAARSLVVGRQVVLGPGTRAGPVRQAALAHELAHVALGHGRESPRTVWRSSVETGSPRGEQGSAPLRGEAPPGVGPGGHSGPGTGRGGAGSAGTAPGPCAPSPDMDCTEALDSPASVDATVLFDVASAALRPGVEDRLNLAGTLWRLAGGPLRMRLDGFASLEGPCVYNWDLSCRRAKAVSGALQRSLLPPMPGVDLASLDVLAQGPSSAAGPALALNRRVTIQFLPQPAPPEPEPEPAPPTPEACSPSGPQRNASGCVPNPHGTHLPDVGGTHTESHAFQPCLLTQAEVAASPDWCVDAQQAHGGEVCYRRIPATPGEPGDQYCYSANCCHNSADLVSTVSPDSAGANACCQTDARQIPGHLWEDVLPEFIDDPERVTRDILGL